MKGHASEQRATQPALLEVEGVSLRFGGILALDEISFTVAKGQVCGLIGPNGAGKSSIFNCLSRIYPVASGDIRFQGRSLLGLARHQIAAAGIGRTFQNLALFRAMTVRQNIMIGGHSRTRSGFVTSALGLAQVRREREALRHKAEQFGAVLNLTPVLDTRVDVLPFATQKRVELARALAGEPTLLLLDEPAGGLHHDDVEELRRTIRDICERLHVTVLLVEHHMNLVMRVSDTVVALNFGRKIVQGSPAEVQNHPEVMRAYLGQVA